MKYLLLIFIFLGTNLLLNSCEDGGEVNARKKTDDSVTPTTEVNYNGTITTDVGASICPTDSTAVLTLDFENTAEDIFDFVVSGGSDIQTITSNMTLDNIVYTGTREFDGVRIFNDLNGDFDTPVSDCSTKGNYSGVVEVSLSGEISADGQTLLNAPYTVSAKCNDPGTTSVICSGSFNGDLQSNN